MTTRERCCSDTCDIDASLSTRLVELRALEDTEGEIGSRRTGTDYALSTNESSDIAERAYLL